MYLKNIVYFLPNLLIQPAFRLDLNAILFIQNFYTLDSFAEMNCEFAFCDFRLSCAFDDQVLQLVFWIQF